ncbi:MAG: UDP-N-acetylglucosamine 1-carboxyvinyltransferase [Minisyncoccia bacterium]
MHKKKPDTTKTAHAFSAIGSMIREARERRSMTQLEFARKLKTSQSAIARIESGYQNISMELLEKIGLLLGERIITTASGTDDFIINGGKKLSGTVTIRPSKNGALHLLCAALINKGTTILHNIPRNQEILRILEVFESMDISVTWNDVSTLSIKLPKKIKTDALQADSASKIRSGLMTTGSLSHHLSRFTLPHSGGCKMGARTIAAHRFGLLPLGIDIETKNDFYEINVSPPKAKNRVVMYEASDTGTTNVLLAAARLPGPTEIVFAQQNYMVMDVCYFLQELGVRIEGMGSHKLTVYGKESFDTTIEHYNSEDPIEAMFFISAALTTRSGITIARVPIDYLELEILKLELMGMKYKRSKPYMADNGETTLCDLTISPSTLTALPDKIHALPFPGINTDNLPFFVPIATVTTGRTMIHDWMWEERAIYFTELNKLGANITLLDPHRIIVEGPTKLRANQIVCPPALRPSAIILVAMLAAEGTSILRNVYAISRGYEDLPARLSALGADIKIINSISG